MVFNSPHFLIFFILFFIFYWFIFNKSIVSQNLLILIGSYIFYAWWDWRFTILLFISSGITFITGYYLNKINNEKKRNGLLLVGLIFSFGSLFFFKYCNFFIESINNTLTLFNKDIEITSLNIMLPLGISFYTFRSVSYLLDIYKGKIKPVKDVVIFFSFVSFFPSLISGPIDKARDFIPQLEKPRIFNYNGASDGLRQILWGLFKKLLIADNCEFLTNKIFENYTTLPASTLVLGAFYFTIQVYADFSAYSDMAIGIARILGFNITKNFDFPFFSQNIAEFWRKWHISLTSWMTEYIYTPLSISFRDYGKWGTIMAILINFAVIGIWHGANWTFILFGIIHGCFFIPLIITGSINKKIKKESLSILGKISTLKNILATFTIVMLTIILFRSNNISQAFDYFSHIFSSTFFSWPEYFSKTSLAFIICLLIVEWIQRRKEHGLQINTIKYPAIRYSIYYIIILLIISQGHFAQSTFIYFKF